MEVTIYDGSSYIVITTTPKNKNSASEICMLKLFMIIVNMQNKII
jgi:hypothetical protein